MVMRMEQLRVKEEIKNTFSKAQQPEVSYSVQERTMQHFAISDAH